ALATGLHAANRSGYDLSGSAGGDIFVPPPASGPGAAAAMAVQITDPALIAASSDGSPGSNGNLAGILAIHEQRIAGGQAPADYYANLVFGVGADIASAKTEQEATARTRPITGSARQHRRSVPRRGGHQSTAV